MPHLILLPIVHLLQEASGVLSDPRIAIVWFLGIAVNYLSFRMGQTFRAK